MSNDWQNALGALLQSGTLPEGEEPVIEEKTRKHGKLTIALEKKGRGGKQVTIISGFNLDYDELAALAARLKSKLGTGGSARGGEILIQGDRRSDVARLLKAEGF